MTITHATHDISTVLKFFGDSFYLKPGQRLMLDETVYDPRTGKVVFFFYCDDDKDDKPKRK